MRTYRILVTWEGNDLEKELLGLKWSNGESKEIVDSDVESGIYAESFKKDDWDGFDTGDFKFNNRQGLFVNNGLSVYWYVERKEDNFIKNTKTNYEMWKDADMEVLESFIPFY